MTELSREIVIDLLPLYIAGEVSDATREAVDDYLSKDPSLAAHVERVRSEPDRGVPRASALSDDVELRSVRRTRKMLATQRWVFALAIAFTSVGLSTGITFENGRISSARLVALDHPMVLVPCLFAALICWIAYARLRRV